MNKHSSFFFISALSLFLFLLPFTFGTVSAACKEPRPAAPPVLVSAISQDRSVTLVWIEAQDPVTYYLVRYGTSRQDFAYGNPNIGPRGTSSFTVGELQNGVKYYFQVMAGNGCKPGEFSNTLNAVAGEVNSTNILNGPKNLSIYKPVLGESTSAAKDKKEGKKTPAQTAAAASQRSCTFSCWAWPLIVLETTLLLGFFYFAKKRQYLMPVYSLFIPVFIYILFLTMQGPCTPYKFPCRHFLPLSITIYVALLIFQKYLLLQTSQMLKSRQQLGGKEK